MSRLAKLSCAAAVIAVSVGVLALSQAQQDRATKKTSDPPKPVVGGKTAAGPPAAATLSANQVEEQAEEAIFRKLQEPTEFSFKEVRLKDAMAAIAKKHKLTILINHKKLEEANVSANAPLSRTERDVSLETGLDRLLRDVGLGYIVRDEVVEITSREEVDTYLISRIYTVADILAPSVHPQAAADPEAQPDYESLIRLIEHAVTPDSWKDAGGPAVATSLPGCLMVEQTIDNHRKLLVFLEALRKVRKATEGSGAHRESAIRVFESPLEQRIEQVLHRRVSVSFSKVVLGDIAKTLSKEHGITIEIRQKKLEEANVDAAKARGTLVADDMSLRSVLNRLLRDHGLSWIVRDDRLIITSREEAETYLPIRLYPVADLVPGGGQSRLERTKQSALGLFGQRAVEPADDDWLLQTIKGTVTPDHWRDGGGSAEVVWMPNVPCLVCSLHQEGHAQLERLLADLRKHVTKPHPKSREELGRLPSSLWTYPIASSAASSEKLSEEAAKLIQELVAPESWKAKDTYAFVRAWPDRIVVRHTAKVHREIQKLLHDVGLLKPPDAPSAPAPPPRDD